VNANPSGSRAPSTGGWGGSEARRELAATTGPPLGWTELDVPTGIARGSPGLGQGSIGGTRHAKTVCRGALNPRRAAQGRVGDQNPPRHIARHLVPHLLLSANTSARADAVRPPQRHRAWPRPAKVLTTENAAYGPQAQPGECCSPRHGAGDAELVQSGCNVIPTSACVLSRGKGVLAA
jgi:hypothetical protein